MTNPANLVTLTGNVSQDIQEFPNQDGSKVLLTTIAVKQNYTSGPDNKVETDFVPVRIFLGKNVEGRGSWGRVGNGDKIQVLGRIACRPYQKNGETVYPAPTIEIDGFPQFLERREVTEARAARKAVQATETAPAETAAPAVAEDSLEAQMARLQAEMAKRDANTAADEDSLSPFGAGVSA